MSLDIADFFGDIENTNLNWMHIRFDAHSDENVMEEFLGKFNSDKWVYCQETTGKNHTHMVLGSPDTLPTPTTINRWIKELTGCTGSQKSTSSVRTTIARSITYICKEKNHICYKGFTKAFIDGCLEQSTKKFNKQDFADDMFANESAYSHDKVSFDEFAYQYSEIKASYGQNHTQSTIKAYLTRWYFNKNHNARRRFYKNISRQIVEDCHDYSDY